MSTIKPKVEINTSTDLHLNLLADPTKIKPQTKNISLDNISEKSDDEDSHVVEQLHNEIRKSSSSRKSSNASFSSNSTKSSKSSKSSPKNLFVNKPIPLPVLPVPVQKPASNFFSSFFGGGLGAPPSNSAGNSAPNNTVQDQASNNNYTFPSNPVKDPYDTLTEEKKRLRRLQKFAELK